MDLLFDRFKNRLRHVPVDYERSLMDQIAWDQRLVGIKGPRGVGKTTMLLQYIKRHYPSGPTALYISLDDLYFASHTLSETVDTFVKQGGKHLFIDEVHRYAKWSVELKNIYDNYPDLRVVFTGSSLLEILNARADLSRRAITYNLQGLSFREFLAIKQLATLPIVSLPNLLAQHEEIATELTTTFRPYEHFQAYLRYGYFPFFRESIELYPIRVMEVINLILEVELPMLRAVETAWIGKLRQLLTIIAQSVPFKPNVSALATKIGLNRKTLLSYLHYLQEAHLTKHLYRNSQGVSLLQKPDKVYLDNTNFAYALGTDSPNTGSLRETFFANQLSYQHRLTYPEKGDFVVDDHYLFEVGGLHKSPKQLQPSALDGYLSIDQLEVGRGQRIPLWLFGLLY